MATMITRNISTITASAYKVKSINADSLTAELEQVGTCEYFGTTPSDKIAREVMGLSRVSNVYLSHEVGEPVKYIMSASCFAAHSTTDRILGGISRTTNHYHVRAIIPGEFDPANMTCKMVDAGEGDYYASSESEKLAREVTETKGKGGVHFVTTLVDSATRYMSVDDFVRYCVEDNADIDAEECDEVAAEDSDN